MVESTVGCPWATVVPEGLSTLMAATCPVGAGLTVPVTDIACTPCAEVGLTDTVTVAAATVETSGVSAKNATSIPAAIVGSAFIWFTED